MGSLNSPSSTRVEVRLSAKNLLDKDLLSKSDPLCVVKTRNRRNQFVEVGRTEQIKNNLNPTWATSVVMTFEFHRQQELRFQIYDVDNSTHTLVDDDYLGDCTVYFSQIMGARGQKLAVPLRCNGAPAGTLTITAQEVVACKLSLEMELCGRGLDRKDAWYKGGKSDPYVEISKYTDDGKWIVVHRSEVRKRDLNPRWKPMSLNCGVLANGDFDWPLLVAVWDWDSDGGHDFIGSVQTSVNGLLDPLPGGFPLINEKKKKKKGKSYNHSGLLIVSKAHALEVPSFVDFVRGGMEVSLMVGIDFTASNGNPQFPSSLHHLNPHGMNQYESSINAVGSILSAYDHDQLFPVWGFGAHFPTVNKTYHCFNANGQPDPQVNGVQGILQAYRTCLQNVKLSGPTYFSHIINSACRLVQSEPSAGAQKYSVLLMLTDGCVTDMQQTIDTIVAAANLPLSIVIVGVGDADFSLMNCLDGDNVAIRASNGKVCPRDIVQFVEFNKVANNIDTLTEETLAEIPGQVLSYFKSRGIVPHAPTAAPPLNHQASAPILQMASINQLPTMPPSGTSNTLSIPAHPPATAPPVSAPTAATAPPAAASSSNIFDVPSAPPSGPWPVAGPPPPIGSSANLPVNPPLQAFPTNSALPVMGANMLNQ